MSDSIKITSEEIVSHLKLTCQIPLVLEGILTHQIIAETARTEQVEVGAEELQEAADRIRLINQLHRSEDTLAWLEKHWMTIDDFEEMVRFSLLSSKLARHLFRDRVNAVLAENQADYWQAAIYEIVLDDADLAWELFYAVQEQETTFYEVARQYAQTEELRRKGGYRGTVQRTDLKPEISAAVFAIEPPQILKPIVTSIGVHLIQVEAVQIPLLNDELGQRVLNDLFSNWLKQQIEVQIKNLRRSA